MHVRWGGGALCHCVLGLHEGEGGFIHPPHTQHALQQSNTPTRPFSVSLFHSHYYGTLTLLRHTHILLRNTPITTANDKLAAGPAHEGEACRLSRQAQVAATEQELILRNNRDFFYIKITPDN